MISLPSLLDRLDRRLLPPTSPARTGVLRAVTGAYTGWYLGRRWRMLRRVHRTDPALFDPVGPVKVLRRPLPPLVADALTAATLASTAAFTAGIAHRVTGPLHAGLLTWTLSYRNSWSMIFHSDNALVLHTAALGLTPSADAVSLTSPRTTGTAHWRYAVAPGLMQGATAVLYWLPGVAKVTGPLGWGWADGEVLRRQIAIDGMRKELLGSRAAGLGLRLYPQTRLFTVMAAGSLVIELVAPLVIVDRRLARCWTLGALGMHWGIFLIMGIRFRHQLTGVIFLPFWPVEKALPR